MFGIRIFKRDAKGRRPLDDQRKSFPLKEMRTPFENRLCFTQLAANAARTRRTDEAR